jgi:hypothetical protein
VGLGSNTDWARAYLREYGSLVLQHCRSYADGVKTSVKLSPSVLLYALASQRQGAVTLRCPMGGGPSGETAGTPVDPLRVHSTWALI